MLFHSFAFALLLVATLAIYNLAPRDSRQAVLLVASYLFYAYSFAPHVLILGYVTVFTYAFGKRLARAPTRVHLSLAIAVVLVPLAFFKYYGFVLELVGVSSTTEARSGLIDLLLPVGVSFYTLQALSYLIDVYREEYPSPSRLQNVALYLAFFPQVLAGPIERAGDLIPQLKMVAPSKGEQLFLGGKTILWGLFCKLVIADKLAMIINPVFGSLPKASGFSLICALLLYSLQIYFDFYGYTRIAIGLGRLFGITLSENFKQPYLATSIRDFWRRWHVTLSSWFRDYLYISLGGNRNTGIPLLLVVLAVFMVSGLWHGASVNFIIWGAIHGAMYFFGRTTAPARDRIWLAAGLGRGSSTRRVIQRACVFGLVTFAWLFFRVNDLTSIGIALLKLSLLDTSVRFFDLAASLGSPWAVGVVVVSIVAFALDAAGRVSEVTDRIPEDRVALVRELAIVNALLISVVLVGDIGSGDYIYFRF